MQRKYNKTRSLSIHVEGMDQKPVSRHIDAAVKLLTGQLPYLTLADKKFITSHGLEFQRVWVQGYVASVSIDGNSFEITDSAGPPLTVCCRDGFGKRSVGEYVLVVGKLCLKKTLRKNDSNRSQDEGQDRNKGPGKRRKEWQVAGQVVRPLNSASRRSQLWQQEVRYLHQAVYPQVAQQPG